MPAGHSGVVTAPGDYYEDDEPLEDVLRAYEAGEGGVTAPPPELRSRALFFDPGAGRGRETDLTPFGQTEHAASG